MNRRRIIFLIILISGVAAGFFMYRDIIRSEQIYTYGEESLDGIGKFYMGREIASVIGGHGAIQWLEREDRILSEKPQIVIEAMRLNSTDVIADIGAGSGYFTFRLAPLVPQGKVYAVEIGEEMIEFLTQRKIKDKVNNVIVHTGTIEDTQLPANSIDIAFMVDSYHEFSHPKEMLESIIEALKPNGRVLFVEYKGEDPTISIKPLHKMTVDQLKKEMTAVGLRYIETTNDLPIQHISTFQKLR